MVRTKTKLFEFFKTLKILTEELEEMHDTLSIQTQPYKRVCLEILSNKYRDTFPLCGSP